MKTIIKTLSFLCVLIILAISIAAVYKCFCNYGTSLTSFVCVICVLFGSTPIIYGFLYDIND
jgi:hypothetical protein